MDNLPFVQEFLIDAVLDWNIHDGKSLREEMIDNTWADLYEATATEDLARLWNEEDNEGLVTTLELSPAGALGPDALFVVTISRRDD